MKEAVGDGHPKDLPDLAVRSLVGHVDDLVHTPELNCACEFLRDWRSSIEVSTAIGQFEAVRAGAGIGIRHELMPTRTDLIWLFPELSVACSF